MAEGEDFLQPDSWSLLGHVAPARLFLLNLFVLLIVSDTEPLPGPGRIQGHAECDRATCSSTDHTFYSELLYFRDPGIECRAW